MVRGFYLVEVLRSEVIAKGFSLLLSEKGARRALDHPIHFTDKQTETSMIG
jgi:hypothetical protein